MSLRVKTLSGDTAELSDERLEELEMNFHGPLIGPQTDDYDEARVVQNALFDRRPGLIIRCLGTADVIDAVKLAGEHELLTAVRGGGHSVAGHSICDDGLLIDLSAMRGVWLDPDQAVVRVQGGATWGDVDRETQAFGLAVPGGIVSTTGVAGLTLGGGIGWLHRKFGLACDSLQAVELVTANGELVRTSESENEELFWALRGGGGNFGVVTAFEFSVHELGPIVMAAAPIYAVDRADDLLSAWRDWASTAPDEVTTRAVLWSMPEDPGLPPPVHNQQVLILGAVYAGPADEGEKILQPIRDFDTPLADLSAQMPYRAFQSAFDPFFPKGEIASYWKSLYMNELTDHAIGLITKFGVQRTSPLTLVHVPLMGGAVGQVGATETAFGDRSAPYMLSVDGNWVDVEQSEEHIQWVRDVIADAEGLSTGGTYLNFGGEEDPNDSRFVEAAFGQNLERLAAVKKEYDPDNLFRLNNNIQPAA